MSQMVVDEFEGGIEFTVEQKEFWDKSLREYVVFYKLLGDSKFKLFRNNKFELVFVHLNEDWMRQAKIDLNGMDSNQGIDVKLSWGKDNNMLGIRGQGQGAEYKEVTAMQIDN